MLVKIWMKCRERLSQVNKAVDLRAAQNEPRMIIGRQKRQLTAGKSKELVLVAEAVLAEAVLAEAVLEAVAVEALTVVVEADLEVAVVRISVTFWVISVWYWSNLPVDSGQPVRPFARPKTCLI